MHYYKKSIFIAGLYLLTIVTLSVVGLASPNASRSWHLLLFGLTIGSFGSIFTFLALKNWETSLIRFAASSKRPQAREEEENVDYISGEKQQETVNELNETRDLLHKLEKDKEQYELRMEDINRDLETLKAESEEELRRKTVLLSEYQETINQQREVIQKKQEMITELESKIQDLNYEVKTLLQLAEIGGSGERQIKKKDSGGKTEVMEYGSPDKEKTATILKRCIDNAQKITGASHFTGGKSRFWDLPIENFALDKRRLFDALRNESAAAVFVFSPKENRILFANDRTKNLLGLDPDSFTRDFAELIEEKETEWKQGLSRLSRGSQSKIRLLIKNGSGQQQLVDCHLGVIPTGIFRSHVIGVLH